MEYGSLLPLFRRAARFACSKLNTGTSVGEASLAKGPGESELSHCKMNAS